MRTRSVDSLIDRLPSGRAALAASIAMLTLVVCAAALPSDDPSALYAETFDTHWERLRDDYPYFEFYGVDWEQERAEHRPRALAAANPTEFAWELARLLSALPDPHVSFMPPIETMRGHWAIPDLKTAMIERRAFVLSWADGQRPPVPPTFADDPYAYPEIVEVRGEAFNAMAQFLAAGPLGTTFDVRLRWPDGTEVVHTLRRPDESNIPPPSKHFGEHWLVTGRVGDIGYMRVKTFSPDMGTLGPDGKMTTMLRAALAELADTAGLVLDLQHNGGGVVAASDPFLGNFIERRLSYRWGNDGGTRVIRPRRPRYRGDVVAVVDEHSASGGEWAARILRDAGRAVVVGGPTTGAEAAVERSEGPDGSVVTFSAWPMVEPGRTPFQGTGIELDHALPLTIADVQAHGFEQAEARVRRARFAQALEVLGAPADALDALVALADEADSHDEQAEDGER